MHAEQRVSSLRCRAPMALETVAALRLCCGVTYEQRHSSDQRDGLMSMRRAHGRGDSDMSMSECERCLSIAAHTGGCARSSGGAASS